MNTAAENHSNIAQTAGNICDRILRRPEVLRIAGVSNPTLWRMEREGRFPKRIALGPNSAGWLESEVKEWLDNLVKNREAVQA